MTVIARAREHARELALLFAVALVLRVAALFLLGGLDEPRGKDAWSWGYEAGCIAQSLVDDHGYAGQWARDQVPWSEHAPTTGWLTPVYPRLVAAAMQLGHGVTPLTAGLVLGVQCLLSALTCLFVWGLGSVLGDLRLARLAAWVLALHPYAIWNSAHTVWDTTCVAFALTLFVELLLRYGRNATVARAIGLGAAFGALLMVNPAPASIFPVALWFLVRDVTGIDAKLARAAAFGVAAFVVCFPWCWRNREAVGSFALRTNLGVELMVGNNDVANGYFQTSLHPSYNADEFRRYVALGEVPYAAACQKQALDWITADPVRWARLTLHRAWIFWAGDFPLLDPRTTVIDGVTHRSASDWKSWVKWAQYASFGVLCLVGAWSLAKKSAEGKALLAMLLLFPGPYYLTHVLERYRFPIEPLIVLCGCACVLALFDRVRARRIAP